MNMKENIKVFIQNSIKIDSSLGAIYIDTFKMNEAPHDAAYVFALVPIGGMYTMDAKKAAELINIIKPKMAIPTHYGAIVGSPKDAEVFARLVNDDIEVVSGFVN